MKPQFYPNGSIQSWYASGPDTAFMVPSACWLTDDEAKEYLSQSEGHEPGDEEYYTEGWYARLTAPGYMDCTDWQGPYPTFFRAIRDLLRTYDVDLNGNSYY